MNRLLSVFITTTLLLGFAACVEAERRPHVNDSYGPYDRAERFDIGVRIENQQRRIDQGISSGELTRREADVLIDNLNWIRDEYSAARRDGRLSQSEIERLSRHLDQNNRMIRDKKNNEIRRVYTAPPPPPAPRHEPPRNDYRDRKETPQRRTDPGAASDEQPRSDLRDLRMDNQQTRIDQAVAKGELTRREATIVRENLDRIRAAYSRMKAAGSKPVHELDKIDKKLDRNDNMIHDKRRNAIERID